MNQLCLEEAVARATGESLREIRHRGFSIADALAPEFDQESWNRPPLVLDWDQVEARRPSIFP